MTIDYKPLNEYLDIIAVDLYDIWNEEEGNHDDIDMENIVDTSKYLSELDHLRQIEDYIWVILEKKLKKIVKEIEHEIRTGEL